jgi:signal transduction histidine kinase
MRLRVPGSALGVLRSRGGPQPWSLQVRIVIIAVVACLATMALGAVAMVKALDHDELQMLDGRLVGLADVLLTFSEHEFAEVVADGRLDLGQGEPPVSMPALYRYQVWSREGRLLLRSASAPTEQPLSPLKSPGFAEVRAAGETLRVYSTPARGGELLLQVAEVLGEREYSSLEIGGRFAAYLVLPFLLVCGLATWQLRRSLAAVDAAAAALRLRSPIDLTPVQPDGAPRELLPMLEAMNALFARIEHSLNAEHDFCAMAAHELRTPLSGLRAQAQLARGESDGAARDHALAAIMNAVDRASYLVDQMLDLARSERLRDLAQQGFGPVRADLLLAEVQGELRRSLAARHVAVRARLEEPLIQGFESGLVLLLRNLLSNAIRHSPPGAVIDVAIWGQARAVVLVVDDAGPGIAASDRAAAFERFNRLGQVGDDGVGLGLAIVGAVARQHGAEIQLLDSPLGGLRVEVAFPRP